MIDPRIFRAYDIRGVAGTQVTEEACHRIGQAFGVELTRRGAGKRPTIVLGRDARLSSPALEQATLSGLLAAGCHVLCIGQTPSPVTYFTVCQRGCDGGVHITASHNPKDDNGIKLCTRDADAFSGEDLQKLRRSIEAHHAVPIDQNPQHTASSFDAITPYIHTVTSLFANVGTGLKIAVDSGNGVAGPVYCDILRKVGCEVTELYTEPDGNFPNHPADPSKHSTLKDLRASVQNNALDLGIAFDGDGDRLGVIDGNGSIVTADQTLLLLAKDHLSRFPGAPVIFTVSNSGLLQSEVTAWGGRPVMCPVGHSHVEHAMRHEHAMLGGEQSGHFFCGEQYHGFDDALVAALRVLSILQHGPETLAERIASMPAVYQAEERRPACPDEEKFALVARLTEQFRPSRPVDTMDGARIDFGEGAWAGIRASNTSPCLSICIEARSPEHLARVEEEVLRTLRTCGITAV